MNVVTINFPLPAKAFSRVDPIQAIFHSIYPVAMLIESDGMNIDLQAGLICENERVRRRTLI